MSEGTQYLVVKTRNTKQTVQYSTAQSFSQDPQSTDMIPPSRSNAWQFLMADI